MTAFFPPLRVALTAAMVLAAAVPVRVTAQDVAPPVRTPERLTGVLSTIAPQSLVRVSTGGYQLEEAVVTAFDDETVTLRSEDLSIDVPLGDIRGLAVRDSHWLQGTLWGGASGAVLGSVVGVMVGSWGCVSPVECEDGENRGGILGGVIGGAVGGLGGFVIGRHSLYWRPVFP